MQTGNGRTTDTVTPTWQVGTVTRTGRNRQALSKANTTFGKMQRASLDFRICFGAFCYAAGVLPYPP